MSHARMGRTLDSRANPIQRTRGLRLARQAQGAASPRFRRLFMTAPISSPRSMPLADLPEPTEHKAGAPPPPKEANPVSAYELRWVGEKSSPAENALNEI